MKKTYYIAIFALATLIFASCNDYKGYKKTENGLYYRFHNIQSVNGQTPQIGDVVNISMEIKGKNDSIIEPAKKFPTMMQISKFKGDIFEAIQMMHVGDSATFIIPAMKYYKVFNYGEIPSFVNDKTMLWITLCLNSIQTFDEYKATKVQEAVLKEKEMIAEYLRSENIIVEPTESGLYYIETKAGKGSKPTKGKKCSVHYRGTLLDGTEFDSSYDREPFVFELGVGQVIKAWDEGIALMKKGGKAKFVIPSNIAYGEHGAGNLIPPYSPLIFEVELLNFE